MKKILLTAIGIITMAFSYGQDITDAVRFSNDNVQGSARFKSMSGAFGALGGDLSAVSINPAGSAFFNNSYASVTLSYQDNDNKSNYFGSQNRNNDIDFNLNQLGGAFVFKNTNSNSPWEKFVLSINYEQTSNFNNEFFASGSNDMSIDNYFLDYAQGLRLDEISAFDGESYTDAYGDIGAVYGYNNQQAFLGYESYILEPDTYDNDNTNYSSNIAPGNFYHEYSYITTGNNNKLSFNAAMKYQDNFYFGLNLNTHFVDFNRSTYLFESNDNLGSLVNEVGFENNLKTYGSGFSFQLGGIAKLNDFIRLGVSYDSPVWYTMNDETTQYIGTLHDYFGDGLETQSIDPRIVNIYEEYKIQTPDKLTGSLALIIGNNGLISFDYSRKDYSKTKYKPANDSYFRDLNSDINNILTIANTYKLGGEFRHNQLSFRGGYRLEQSPYKDSNFYGDLKGYSLGIGYSFGNTKLDLAYETAEREYNQKLYQVGLTDTVGISNNNDLVSLSLSFNF